MGVFTKLQRSLAGPAGHRFQDRYNAARKSRENRGWTNSGVRLIRILLALGATAIGIVLAFIPGPAILFFLIAGGLLSAESRGIARLLDWSEVKLRKLWHWGKRHWDKTPGWGQVMLTICVLGMGAATAYASYQLVVN